MTNCSKCVQLAEQLADSEAREERLRTRMHEIRKLVAHAIKDGSIDSLDITAIRLIHSYSMDD